MHARVLSLTCALVAVPDGSLSRDTLQGRYHLLTKCMLERVNEIPWSAFPQPSWNKKDAIPDALVSLSSCRTKDEAVAAYHRVLYALGNNHAGTYYPVVLQALPFLGEIIQFGTPIAREGALDVMVDLVGSFWPEAGFETVDVPEERSADLKDLVLRHAQGLGPIVQVVAQTENTSSHTLELARDLLAILDDDAT